MQQLDSYSLLSSIVLLLRKTLVSKSEIETDFKSVSDLRGLPFSDRLKHKHWCGVMDKSSIGEQYKIVKKRKVIFFFCLFFTCPHTLQGLQNLIYILLNSCFGRLQQQIHLLNRPLYIAIPILPILIQYYKARVVVH